MHIWVDWPNRAGAQPATADTELTPPVGAYSTTSGHIAVSVLDSDANPLYDVGVTITGPTAESSPTNSSGCAFFAFIPAGTYTVALNTVGYVDRQGNANPSQTVGVSVGQVSSVQFDYDKASTIQATFGAANGGVVPTDLPITIANTILLPTGTKTLHRYRNHPLDREPVPGQRRLRDVGRPVCRRRPRGNQLLGRGLLPGRDA